MLQGYAYNCVGRDGMTKEDIDKIVEGFSGSVENLDLAGYKCFFTCMAEQFGVVSFISI